MSRWFRLYDDLLDDPKVQRLDPVLFKTWINLLCLASKNDGALPTLDDMAFALRLEPAVMNSRLADLVTLGLIDQGETMMPHKWNERQFKSDNSTERSRKHRATHQPQPAQQECNVAPAVAATPPETETETETEAERENARAQGHREVAGEILKDKTFVLSPWEDGFLANIAQVKRLSSEQKTQFEAISARWKGKQANAPPIVPRIAIAEGTPEFAAWERHVGRMPRADVRLDDGRLVRGWYFPSKLPPTQEQAA